MGMCPTSAVWREEARVVTQSAAVEDAEASRRAILAAWLLSAALVTGLRCLNVADIGYDLTFQIQAAQNLIAGNGLSIYKHDSPDLSQPARLFTLTHFPAGFSLLTAGLLSVGATLPIIVKLQGAVATMLGWWGWGRLGESFLSADAKRSRVWWWVAVVIAIVTPLRYTPPWWGTDVVLWAAVPWVLLWVVTASADDTPRSNRLDLAAGAVCGVCIMWRYASLFLAAYVGAVILWQSRLRLAVVLRRSLLFGLGCLPAVAVQLYINEILAVVPARPGGLEIGENNTSFIAQRAWEGVSLFGNSNYAWLFWLPGQAVDFLTLRDGAVPWRAAILAVVTVVFVVSIMTYRLGPLAAGRDPRIVCLGLFMVLPLALWVCTMLSHSTFMADQRYYWSLVPLGVLLFHALASRSETVNVSMLAAVIYVVGYVGVSALGIMLLFTPGERGSMQRTRLIGTASFAHWPSTRATYETYEARQFVVGLLSRDPGIILLTTKAQWFLADGAVDRSRLMVLRKCDELPTYVSRPARVVILTFDEPGPAGTIWAWGRARRVVRAPCLENLPGLRPLARFADEGVKVLESWVPAGTALRGGKM